MSAIIAWINRLDTIGLTAENANPAHPISNLQRRGLAEFAEPVDDRNMLYVYPDAHLPDTDFVAFLGVDAGTYEVEQFNSVTGLWHTVASVSTLANEPRYGLPMHAFIAFPSPISAVDDIRFVCPARVSRLWAGPSLRLPDGIGAQWRMGFRDYGNLEAGEGRTHVETPGVRARVLTIPVGSALGAEVAWGIADGVPQTSTRAANLHALQMEAGTTGEVIAIPRTSSPIWMASTGIYGHITSEWEIEHEAGPYSRASIVLEEER